MVVLTCVTVLTRVNGVKVLARVIVFSCVVVLARVMLITHIIVLVGVMVLWY